MTALGDGWYHVGGLRFHALTSRGPANASGPPVVLVHGLGIASESLAALGERLAEYRAVVIPDLPGFGLSDKPRKALDVEELASWLARFVETTQPGRVHVLGNSFGCEVVVELAERRPDLVGRLVLQSPIPDPRARTLAQQILRYLQNYPHERGSDPREMLRAYARAGVPRILRTMQISVRYPIARHLPEVRSPALVVRGEHDRLVPQRWAEEAARLLPGGSLKVIPGVAHSIHLSAPGELARAAHGFLGVASSSPQARSDHATRQISS